MHEGKARAPPNEGKSLLMHAQMKEGKGSCTSRLSKSSVGARPDCPKIGFVHLQLVKSCIGARRDFAFFDTDSHLDLTGISAGSPWQCWGFSAFPVR